MKRSRADEDDAASQDHKQQDVTRRLFRSEQARLPAVSSASGILSTLLTWSSGAPSAFFDAPQDDAAVRCTAMNSKGLELLTNLPGVNQLQEAVLVRYQLQEELSSASALVGGAVLCTLAFALPCAVRTALLFGCAANSMMQMSEAFAWHHYMILECPKCSISLELLRRGVCVRVISQSEPRGRQLIHQHRQELKSCDIGKRVKVAEEIRCLDLECGLGLQPVLKWLTYVVSQQYDIVNWNCQHFSQDLVGMLSSFIRK